MKSLRPVLTEPRRRAIRHGLVLGGFLLLLYGTAWAASGGHIDIHDYWLTRPEDAYRNYALGSEGQAYTPVWTLAFSPLTTLPFPLVYAGWFCLNLAVAVWLLWPLGRFWMLVGLLYVSPELTTGNVHLLIAAAVVLACSGKAWALAFPILTKVTPGLALTWQIGRGEWRGVLSALGTTAVLVAASWVIAPDLWPRWWTAVTSNLGTAGPELLWIPLLPRLPVAILIGFYAARTSRAWLMPVAVLVGLPHIFLQSLSLLAGCIRLAPERGRGAERIVPAPAGVAGSAS